MLSSIFYDNLKIDSFLVILWQNCSMFRPKNFFLLVFFGFFGLLVQSQSAQWQLNSRNSKIRIPFEKINNLVVFSLELNGLKRNFIFDSGVRKTLVFYEEDLQNFDPSKAEKISIQGLGGAAELIGFRSKGNQLRYKKLSVQNFEVLWINAAHFEFSKRMGLAIGGIIGVDFLRNFRVTLDYKRKQLILESFNRLFKAPKKSRKYPLSFIHEKPFIPIDVELGEDVKHQGIVLMDSGSSDALWLFEGQQQMIAQPPYFQDFLGRGITGDVYGKRGKVKRLKLAGQTLKDVKVAYPDTTYFRATTFNGNRIGSIGGELLSRFWICWDYAHNAVYLKERKNINASFYYNLSGLEVQYSSLALVRERVYPELSSGKENGSGFEGKQIFLQPRYTYKLRPLVEISEVRPGSPAAEAGILAGDILVRINGKPSERMKLSEVNALLQQKPGRKIQLVLRRKFREFKVQLRLREVF